MIDDIFTTLNYFMNEEVSVIEVKINNLPDSDQKPELIHWLKIIEGSTSAQKVEFRGKSLEIVNDVEINIVLFKDGELRYDHEFGKFQQGQDGHIVMIRPVSEISTINLELIKNYAFSLMS